MDLISFFRNLHSLAATANDGLVFPTSLGDHRNKDCAIVGNGGVLLDFTDGPAIDAHDVVIRCNQTSLKKYSAHTGTRTDIRIVNSHFFTTLKGVKPPSNKDFISHLKAVLPKFDPEFLYTLSNEILISKCGTEFDWLQNEVSRICSNNNLVTELNPSFYAFANSLISPSELSPDGLTHATNGFIAILLGLKFFKSVSIFGFGFYKETKKHYFQTINEELDVGVRCHNNHSEEVFCRDLYANKLIGGRL